MNAVIDLDTLPGFEGQTWHPNGAERAAAWELWLDVATRAASPDPDHRHLRGELTELYQLVGSTRDILRRHGPDAARGPGITVAHLAVTMLKDIIFPPLAIWHPALMAYEETRPAETDRRAWERQWAHQADLRAALDQTWQQLTALGQVLAEANGG